MALHRRQDLQIRRHGSIPHTIEKITGTASTLTGQHENTVMPGIRTDPPVTDGDAGAITARAAQRK
ncbi:hypothetical protein Plo01_49250 [Planobispora longispora]|uniref:Uncharacterized protein n=1 Tax=Planobispora longispora TaxID=28887 RepID=A0A8J3W854_9ACTN|nr:hypothetical protein GCM10020093_066370 [Planobispora longispora]GIH78496.1 hypothetical protein Plo01_49250 [Planobispora longispora]